MPRTNFSGMAKAMLNINAEVVQYAECHNTPLDFFMEQPTELHPVSLSAARKLRILAPYVEEFLGDLGIVMRNFGLPDGNTRRYYNVGRELTMSFPVIWNAKKDGVICFPNLSMDAMTQSNSLRNENPWFPKCSVTLHERIRDDLSDSKKSQAWLPVSRGIRRLGTRTETSVSRALSRAFLWEGQKFSCPQYIDNTAARLIEMHQPADFQFANTVDEIRAMYIREGGSETPSSCMDSQHNFALRRPDRPVDFYAHCPVTMGAYLSRSGIVTARTLCWFDSESAEWYHTRVYSSRNAQRDELCKHLDKHNIKPIDSHRKRLRVTAEFDVPAGEYNDSSSCPMPYFDAMPFDGLVLKLSDDATMFHVRIGERKIIAPRGEKWQYPNLTSTSGSYCIYETSECNNCSSEIDTENDSFWNVEGDIYCSVSCAEENDALWYATAGDSNLVYHRNIDFTNTVRAYHGNGIFSNENAARVRGCVYHPVPWADVERHMFIYWDDENGDDMGLCHIGRADYQWDAKHKSSVRMYCDAVVTPGTGIDYRLPYHSDGSFRFHSLPIVDEFTNPKKVDDTTTVMRYIATCDNPSNFDDSMFDEYIADLLQPHAPLLAGVTTITGE